MTTTNEAGTALVLKTDAAGRVKMPAEQRERLLDEFERSGLSGAKFAALAGIKYQTFATWVQRQRKQRPVKSAAKTSSDKLRWLEAVIEQAQPVAPSGNTPLILQLPGSVRVEITESGQAMLAAVLVRALAQPPLSC
jgi:hypothetical protein